MKVERSRPRIAPKEFADYSVQVTLEDRYFTGKMGNISEEGMCVLIPGSVAVSDSGSAVKGTIQSRQLADTIGFNGSVAWASDAAVANRPHTLVGVKFDRSVELPVSLIALGMSAMHSDD